MRITEFEKNTIKNLAHVFYGNEAKVTLFGSRVDDAQKGGDIDIFIETTLNKGIETKLNFLVQLENIIGEQKIDLVVKSPNTIDKPIFKIAKETGIPL